MGSVGENHERADDDALQLRAFALLRYIHLAVSRHATIWVIHEKLDKETYPLAGSDLQLPGMEFRNPSPMEEIGYGSFYGAFQK